MLFHVSCHLEYAVRFPSTLILNVHAQRNASQTILEEQFVVEPRREGQRVHAGRQRQPLRPAEDRTPQEAVDLLLGHGRLRLSDVFGRIASKRRRWRS